MRKFITLLIVAIAIGASLSMTVPEAATQPAVESNGYHSDGESGQAPVAKPTPPPATIFADEVDSLRFHAMQLDAAGRRAKAEALIAQAVNIEAQANQLFEAIRLKLCKAHGVDPNDYDGQISDKGLVLVRKETPPAKP